MDKIIAEEHPQKWNPESMARWDATHAPAAEEGNAFYNPSRPEARHFASLETAVSQRELRYPAVYGTIAGVLK